MNNTITKLWEDAAQRDDIWEQARYEKFAELIIKECARVARATSFPDTDVEVRKTFGHTWDMASVEAGREIIKHFGVGE
jgi:hypothetical protein